jgi:RHH-type proline utilization regulon transcriptional repressor/proline dehydrogenase/delta 1-pyrroline-5-carboxylate dehydrogenase
VPHVAKLAALAKRYDIGFNIDAEEADRLDLSLDILERLAADPALADWQGSVSSSRRIRSARVM